MLYQSFLPFPCTSMLYQSFHSSIVCYINHLILSIVCCVNNPNLSIVSGSHAADPVLLYSIPIHPLPTIPIVLILSACAPPSHSIYAVLSYLVWAVLYGFCPCTMFWYCVVHPCQCYAVSTLTHSPLVCHQSYIIVHIFP